MYISDYNRPLECLDVDLHDILSIAVEHNQSNDITGVLFFDNGKFIQILEGEKDKLHPLIQHIKDDTRHKNFKMLMDEPIDKREIEDWSMKAFDLSEHEAQDWSLLEDLRDAYLKTFKISSKQITTWVNHFIKDYARFKRNERSK